MSRWPGKGIFLYPDELAESHFFFLNGPGRLYCTDLAKVFIESQGYTNVDLAEVGVTIKRGDPIPIQVSGSAPLGFQSPPPVTRPKSDIRTFAILGFSDVPMDIEGIKRFGFQIPRLASDMPESCPLSSQDVDEYLEVESVSEGPFFLNWCRTAEIEGAKYWLWDMDDAGSKAFVYVLVRNKQTIVGMNSANGLSAEQFLVLEHLRNSRF